MCRPGRRYQDTVRFYQIWNEPNIAPHWGNRLIDPVGYARLLRAAAVAVRDADPDAVILAAALAPTQDRGHTATDEGFFLQRLYAAGAAPYFDAVLVQPFGFGTAPADPRSRVDALNFRRAAWVRRVMVVAGDAQTPIWAVRFGWNRQVQDHWKTVSSADQLRLTEEAIRYAQANWPWLAAMGWPVDRPAAPPSDPMWGFSLVTPEGNEHALLSVFTEAAQATTETEPSATMVLLNLRFALLMLASLVGSTHRPRPASAPLAGPLPDLAAIRQAGSLGPPSHRLLPCRLAAADPPLLARRRTSHRRRAGLGTHDRGRRPALPLSA